MSEEILPSWSRHTTKFPYTDTHKAEALKIADELGFGVIKSGLHKGKLQRPWTDITRKLKQVCPELRELTDHRLRGAVNRWLDADVRERERSYQQRRRDEMQSSSREVLLEQKRAYAKDPEIRELINKRVRERKAERTDVRITANFRSRFAAMLKGSELGANEYGYSFSKAEKIYLPVIQTLAGELDAFNAENPDEIWVIDHKRPLASYALTYRVDFLQEAWAPRNLAIITQSENSRKASCWNGMRWTYAHRDGDNSHAVGMKMWREEYPKTVMVAMIDRPYLEGNWEDAEYLIDIAGQAQQKKLSMEGSAQKYGILLQNQLINQRDYQPVAPTISKYGPATAWETKSTKNTTQSYDELIEENDKFIDTQESMHRQIYHQPKKPKKGFG